MSIFPNTIITSLFLEMRSDFVSTYKYNFETQPAGSWVLTTYIIYWGNLPKLLLTTKSDILNLYFLSSIPVLFIYINIHEG